MDETKNTDIETTEDSAPETTAEPGAAEPEATADPADAAQKALWRAGLVQEALSNRPELRKLATKKDFAASRRIGYDLGFEDGARKLTLPQLEAFGALKDRRMASYAPHEMPGELRGHLDERGVGLDERGFLAGYVDGVGDFLQAYKEQLRRQD
jgi:hypothetical protein